MCRDRACAEAGATTGAGNAAEAIAVIDVAAIELRDETRPPLDHHQAHIVVLHHQGTSDARAIVPSSRTRYLVRGRYVRSECNSTADNRILLKMFVVK